MRGDSEAQAASPEARPPSPCLGRPAVAVHDGNIVIGLFGLNKVEIHTSYFGVGTSNFSVSVALSADVLAVGDNEAIYVYTSCDPGAFWNDQTAACESCGLGTYSAGGVGAQCGN